MVYTGTFLHILKFARLFAEVRDIDAVLVFIGGGPEEPELRQLAGDDCRIVVKPFMHENCLRDEFRQADYLLNPRDTEWRGSQFSFPSKMFDYMMRGIPIISTKSRGIPSKYFECFLEVSDQSADAFAATLRQALSVGERELADRVRAGLALSDEMSPQRIGRVIIAAIEGTDA